MFIGLFRVIFTVTSAIFESESESEGFSRLRTPGAVSSLVCMQVSARVTAKPFNRSFRAQPRLS